MLEVTKRVDEFEDTSCIFESCHDRIIMLIWLNNELMKCIIQNIFRHFQCKDESSNHRRIQNKGPSKIENLEYCDMVHDELKLSQNFARKFQVESKYKPSMNYA